MTWREPKPRGPRHSSCDYGREPVPSGTSLQSTSNCRRHDRYCDGRASGVFVIIAQPRQEYLSLLEREFRYRFGGLIDRPVSKPRRSYAIPRDTIR